MTDETFTLSEAQIDYLRELANIGMGNAAGTLSFILRRPVNSQVPSIRVGTVSEVCALFGHRATPLTGIRLALTGGIKGSLIFFLAEHQRFRLVELARERAESGPPASDEMILTLVAQAVATSNLDAIKWFCGLDIRHSEPALEMDLFSPRSDSAQAFLIESTFAIEDNRLEAYLLLIPHGGSLQVLTSSIDDATRMMSGKG